MANQKFVARHQQLAELHTFLTDALQSKGQVHLISGEAGSGKTALVTEFSRQAELAHRNLVVAIGNCNAQTGIGDPYLPFREILAQLTGDVDPKLAQGAITSENARRLRGMVGWTLDAIIEFGPDLINILVPGSGLIAKAGGFMIKQTGWSDKFKQLVERKSTGPRVSTLDQSHIFEQTTNMLKALAMKRPLILVLDDLQWADAASISLLFHLGRRISDSRIFLLCAFRPEEVELGRAGDRHPLNKVLAEFKRYHGDVTIDLNQAEADEAREFVDSLLDLEPNHLGQDFRTALVKHTGGHPLFAVELLRDMQERGNLEKDGEGLWIESSSLNWSNLPPRVEGVIEERINRLSAELQETLTVGSVQGEEFTAEVIARVQKADERGLVRKLSNELDRQHHLVVSQGIQRLGSQLLSAYRFRHNLFQSYLYGQLGSSERAYLHEDIGNVLEALYGEHTDIIAVQLARHFDEAGIVEKARYYLKRAGDLAYQRYALDEALHLYTRALDLSAEADYPSRFTLLLATEKIHHLQGEREAQEKNISSLERLAEAMDNNEAKAEVALRWANYAEAICSYQKAITAAQQGIELAKGLKGDSQVVHRLLGIGHQIWATALSDQSQFPDAKIHLDQALQSFEQIGDLSQTAVTLRKLGVCYLYQDKNGEAARYFEQSLKLCQEIGDQVCGGGCLNNLGIVYGKLGQHDRSKVHFEQALISMREVGDRRSEAKALGCLASLAFLLGQYAEAIEYAQQAVKVNQEVGDRQGEAMALYARGISLGSLKAEDEEITILKRVLTIAKEIGDPYIAATSLITLSSTLGEIDQYDQAQTYLDEATAVVEEAGMSWFQDLLISSRANLAHKQGRPADAQAEVAKLLPALNGPETPIELFLLCYEVLMAADDPRATDVLRAAFDCLQERADRIHDESLRRSFLGIHEHQQVIRAWEAFTRNQ